NLDLSEQDRRDLVAYLTAVGDGTQPYEREGAGGVLREVNDFASVLETAIPSHDKDVIGLAVDTIGGELRELTERYPERKNTSVSGGQQERANARIGLKEAVLTLRRIDVAAANGRFDEAVAEYKNYRNLMFAAVPMLLGSAQPWSLFDQQVHDAHYAA